MTDQNKEALRLIALAEKATPGPWFAKRWGLSTVYVEVSIGGGWIQEVAACGPTAAGKEQQEANARLIAEAPAMVNELRRLVAENTALREAAREALEALQTCESGKVVRALTKLKEVL